MTATIGKADRDHLERFTSNEAIRGEKNNARRTRVLENIIVDVLHLYLHIQ